MSEPHSGGATRPEPPPAATVGAGSPEAARRVRRSLLGLLSVLVVYYAVPVGSLPSGVGIAFSLVGLLGGVTLLAWLIVRQAKRLLHGGATDGSVRLDSLIFLLYLVVPMFALGYLALDEADGSQFAELDTKTDALYYTMSTLGTVGFGDVHAVGQLARALVTLQVAFNLVFVAALFSLVGAQIRERAAASRSAGQATPPAPPPQSPGP